MRAARAVVLDNEAVQALADPTNGKHRRALALVEATAGRNLQRAGSQRLIVATAVRVEAGWDRTAPRAAAVNRLRVTDQGLDAGAANRAASIRAALGVSVPDAHLGQVLESLREPVSVITSDTDDVRRIAAHVGVHPQIVRL